MKHIHLEYKNGFISFQRIYSFIYTYSATGILFLHLIKFIAFRLANTLPPISLHQIIRWIEYVITIVIFHWDVFQCILTPGPKSIHGINWKITLFPYWFIASSSCFICFHSFIQPYFIHNQINGISSETVTRSTA